MKKIFKVIVASAFLLCFGNAQNNLDLSNFIENYKNFYESAPILHKNTAGGFFKSFFKMLNIDRRRKKWKSY